jgi:hypothetical protein
MTKITFPNKTAKQIVEDCGNKLGSGKLLYDTDWYKDEDFYTKEKCRKGTREIITDLSSTKGKTWSECKEMGEMLSFAELLWCVIKIPDFLRDYEYSWTSSRTSGDLLVSAGIFGAEGGGVSGWRPRDSHSALGCAFSAVKHGKSSMDTLNGDEASSRGALEQRIKALEDWKNNTFK